MKMSIQKKLTVKAVILFMVLYSCNTGFVQAGRLDRFFNKPVLMTVFRLGSVSRENILAQYRLSLREDGSMTGQHYYFRGGSSNADTCHSHENVMGFPTISLSYHQGLSSWVLRNNQGSQEVRVHAQPLWNLFGHTGSMFPQTVSSPFWNNASPQELIGLDDINPSVTESNILFGSRIPQSGIILERRNPNEPPADNSFLNDRTDLWIEESTPYPFICNLIEETPTSMYSQCIWGREQPDSLFLQITYLENDMLPSPFSNVVAVGFMPINHQGFEIVMILLSPLEDEYGDNERFNTRKKNDKDDDSGFSGLGGNFFLPSITSH